MKIIADWLRRRKRKKMTGKNTGQKEETETVDSLKLQDNAECISDLPDATIKEPAMESPAFVSKESVSGPEDDGSSWYFS